MSKKAFDKIAEGIKEAIQIARGERGIRGRKRRRHQPEAVIQRAVFQHLRTRAHPSVMAWHTPNGGKRGQIEAAILNGLGVLPGIPDVLILRDGYLYGLELKAEGRGLTPIQEATIDRLRACGALVAVASSIDEAVKTLEDWDLLRGRAQLVEAAE